MEQKDDSCGAWGAEKKRGNYFRNQNPTQEWVMAVLMSVYLLLLMRTRQGQRTPPPSGFVINSSFICRPNYCYSWPLIPINVSTRVTRGFAGYTQGERQLVDCYWRGNEINVNHHSSVQSRIQTESLANSSIDHEWKRSLARLSSSRWLGSLKSTSFQTVPQILRNHFRGIMSDYSQY